MAFLSVCTRFNRNLASRCTIFASQSQSTQKSSYSTETSPAKQNEVKPAEYPPILDLSPKAVAEREKLAWHAAVKDLNTIEEKLLKVNMPYYYGLRTTPLENDEYHYNCLPFFQHWTRTQYEDGIPETWCKQSTEEVDRLVAAVKEQIFDAIAFQYGGYSGEYETDPKLSQDEKTKLKTADLCKNIDRILRRTLSGQAVHLKESEVDVGPRHEAFWMCGGIEPPTDKKIWIERKVPLTEEEKNEPIDRPFQYIGNPILSVRHQLPLEPVVDNVEDASFDIDIIPVSRCDPQGIGYKRVYQHVTSIPGYWPGSEAEFGQLTYHNRLNYSVKFNDIDPVDEQNALKAQGILKSFGWLVGQACYQGFSTYNELTYPLTTQTIITNGQNWSFFLYQLNTMVFETVHFEKSRRANKCWGSGEMKLFDSVDDTGNVIGFNDTVLRHLVQFYLSTPKERNYELKPYLNAEESTVADIEHLERRKFLEERFKHILSKRPRHRHDLVPEVYLWEWIYKIKFDTRPVDARRRFFELNEDPWKRRLDEHTPEYIPKWERPGGIRSPNKWKKTYYP